MEMQEVTTGNGHAQVISVDKEVDVDQPEYIEEEVTGCMRYVEVAQTAISSFTSRHGRLINRGILLALLIGFHVYLGFAWAHDFTKAEPLIVIVAVVWVGVIYFCLAKPYLGDRVRPYADKYIALFHVVWAKLPVRIAFYLIYAAAIITFLAIDTSNDRSRLIGLGGCAAFILLMWLLSVDRMKVRWRTVLWGFSLQFVLGLLILRWDWGSRMFGHISHQIVTFLDYTNNGTVFVYGFLAEPPNICGMSGVFAFTSLQVVIYFGSIVALLYHYGVMQVVLRKMAWFMQWTLGTTATESLNACACIFLGQSEAPLLIKPYLERMTASELHAIMCSGFSCIAGSLFAAYISFGACPGYLLSSTVMSAPGSLACSKLLYPETEESQLASVDDLELPESDESNPLECISNGAVSAVELVMAIVANLIVFLALLAFIDAVFEYAGDLIGHEGWSFEKAMGYVFFPLAYLMGVTDDADETLRVAQLMGTKTTLNEFIAYERLGKMVAANPPKLSPRAAMIATYALCGFSNFSSIGIQLGVLGGMAPSRKKVLSRIVLRALMAGCISCFFTACVAGILVETPRHCMPVNMQKDCFNTTAYQEMMKTTLAPPSLITPLPTSSAPHFEL